MENTHPWCYHLKSILCPSLLNPISSRMYVIDISALDPDISIINYYFVDIEETVGCTLILLYTFEKHSTIENAPKDLLVIRHISLDSFR